MLGLSFEKLLLIGLIAAMLIGPQHLPLYASKLATFVRGLRVMVKDAQERMREEVGPEFDDVDWKKLAPRQYDPRRIVRNALWDADAD